MQPRRRKVPVKLEIDIQKLLAGLPTKEGRRISAATRAHLEQAIDHSHKFIACIQDILDGDAQEKAAEIEQRTAAKILNTWAAADVRRF